MPVIKLFISSHHTFWCNNFCILHLHLHRFCIMQMQMQRCNLLILRCRCRCKRCIFIASFFKKSLPTESQHNKNQQKNLALYQNRVGLGPVPNTRDPINPKIQILDLNHFFRCKCMLNTCQHAWLIQYIVLKEVLRNAWKKS